jgi:hypothetical protein
MGPFFNGPDVFIHEDTADVDEAISAILLPKGKTQETAGTLIQDVHHLTAHYMAKCDMFVTLDKRMISRRGQLQSELGIVVVKPSEAIGVALNT